MSDSAGGARRALGWLGRPGVRVWLGYLVLALVYTCPLYLHPTFAGGHLDWRFFHYINEASRTSLLEYGQLPLWNPWGCGGNVHLANPQTQLLSPYFLLHLVFGVTIAAKLFILLHYWLGLVGMHLLVARAGRPTLAAVGSAVVFGLCGFHAMRAGGGHAAFLPFLYLPWLLIAYQASLRRLPWAVLLGLLVAETILEGGIYPLAFFVLLLIFEAVYDVVTAPVPRWRPLAVGAIAGVVFLCVSAVKLGPALQFLSDAPRHIPLDDRLDLTLFLKAFLSRSLERGLPGHEYVWHEYINYVGLIPFAAFFILWNRRDEEPLRRWYYAAVIFALVMLGDQGAFAPYSVLHKLPIFSSLRVPSRFGVLVVLHLALIFGVFLNWFDFRCEDWARRVRWRALRVPVRRGAYLLLALVTLDIGITTARLWSPGFNVEPPKPKPAGELYQTHGGGSDMWWKVRQNKGTPHCYEANFIRTPPPSNIWRGKGPQVKPAEGSAGEIEATEITPNRWELRVDLEEPGRVLVNQNHHRFWRLSGGNGSVVNADGLLAIDVPAGPQQLTLSYWPSGLGWFILLSVLGILGSAAALIISWRRGWLRDS